jgi:predicted GNAT family acetyltransferase
MPILICVVFENRRKAEKKGANITNNENSNRLEVSVNGGLGILRYPIAGDTMWLLHVQLPQEAQGHGVASELSRTALELARERGLKVVPVCSFVAAYIQRHPEYSAIVQ